MMVCSSCWICFKVHAYMYAKKKKRDIFGNRVKTQNCHDYLSFGYTFYIHTHGILFFKLIKSNLIILSFDWFNRAITSPDFKNQYHLSTSLLIIYSLCIFVCVCKFYSIQSNNYNWSTMVNFNSYQINCNSAKWEINLKIDQKAGQKKNLK